MTAQGVDSGPSGGGDQVASLALGPARAHLKLACETGRMNVAEVSVNEIPENAPLVDVREDAEWRAGHAPNAVHVPMSELPARLADIPDDEPLYIICKVGGRSAQVAAWLSSMGREAVNVADGMQSWEAAGRPMNSETGREPFVA